MSFSIITSAAVTFMTKYFGAMWREFENNGAFILGQWYYGSQFDFRGIFQYERPCLQRFEGNGR